MNTNCAWRLLKMPSTYIIFALIATLCAFAYFKPGESGIWAILGSAFTAALTYFIQVAREDYKEAKRIRVVAAAIAGEVKSLLTIIERREYVRTLEGLVASIDAGNFMSSSDFMSVNTDAFFGVYKEHLAEIGVLGVELTSQTTQFYVNLFGLVEDATSTIKLMWKTACDIRPNDMGQARIIYTQSCRNMFEKDLALLKETIQSGEDLVNKLSLVAATESRKS